MGKCIESEGDMVPLFTTALPSYFPGIKESIFMYPLRKISNEIKGNCPMICTYGLYLIHSIQLIFRFYVKYDIHSEKYTNHNEFSETLHASVIKTHSKTQRMTKIPKAPLPFPTPQRLLF